ncbi:hypothetical protein AVEN_163261-1, partial [Araneus ventricosus]
MAPSRADTCAEPNPTVLTVVGKSSVEKTYRMLKEDVMQNFPNKDTISLIHQGSKKSEKAFCN